MCIPGRAGPVRRIVQASPYHGSERPGRRPPIAAAALAALLGLASGACSMSMELGSFLSDKGDAADVTGSLPMQPAKPDKNTGRASGAIHAGDWKLTSAALHEALGRKEEDGASIPWHNPDTGSRGTVTPVASAYFKEGFACRDFLASHVGDGRESWYEGTACRIHRGEWEIRSARPLDKP